MANKRPAGSLLLCGIAFAISAVLLTASLKCDGAEKAPSDKKVTLYGEVNDLDILCSAAGVKLTRNNTPAQVGKISLGSAAAYSGVRTGDKVLNAEISDNMLVLTVERNGTKYQAKIATDVKGLRAEFEHRKVKYSFGDSPFDEQLKTLANCDITIMVDRCATMADNHAGCPGDLTKWSWCKQQVDNLFLATNRLLEEGFRLVLFNDTFQTRNNVTLWDLKEFFARTKPEGARKDISTPLASLLDEYFKRRTPKSKPCLIVVLTEGTHNVGQPLQDVLIEASKRMTRQGEVMLTFMQVGDSLHGEELFNDLDRNLQAKGARYDLATYIPFSELRNKGLLWEMIAAVKDTTKASIKTSQDITRATADKSLF